MRAYIVRTDCMPRMDVAAEYISTLLAPPPPSSFSRPPSAAVFHGNGNLLDT